MVREGARGGAGLLGAPGLLRGMHGCVRGRGVCGACAGRVRAGVHIVSIQLRRKGSVTILSTVSCSDSKTSGRSGSTQGWVMTKGAPPAVVARKPASCRRFIRLTADIVPHRSFSRPRNSSHLVRVKRV